MCRAFLICYNSCAITCAPPAIFIIIALPSGSESALAGSKSITMTNQSQMELVDEMKWKRLRATVLHCTYSTYSTVILPQHKIDSCHQNGLDMLSEPDNSFLERKPNVTSTNPNHFYHVRPDTSMECCFFPSAFSLMQSISSNEFEKWPCQFDDGCTYYENLKTSSPRTQY